MRWKCCLGFLLLFFTIVPISYAQLTISHDVTVTGTVPPKASDFQLAVSSAPTSSTTVNQFQTITYTITYGSHLYYATPMTIVASWTQGTIQGQSSPSVDIADYVLGSATNAYGNTAPVIDLTNKTITWTISSFPAQTTDQTVSFQLETNASYTGANTVTFTTTAHLSVNNVTIPDQSTNTTYQFSSALTPTPTVTPTPTFTPTPPVTASPTLTPTNIPAAGTTNIPTIIPTNTPTPSPIPYIQPEPFTFTKISIISIGTDHASITAQTNKPATLLLSYGLSLHQLNQTISSSNFSTSHELTLSQLAPNTVYYFHIIATDKSREKITSDYFIVKTGTAGQIPTIDPNSLIITSENVILYDSLLNKNNDLHNSIVIPTNTSYNFQFSLSHPEIIKRLEATFVNDHVLGMNTFSPTAPSTNNVTLLQIKPGIYAGRLLSSQTPGVYQLSITVYDANGNITPQKIVNVWVDNPIHILSKKTNQPIEKAKITLFLYDQSSGYYREISPQTLPIQNPNYTDSNGILASLLPQGIYQAKITALFYKPQTITFTIAPDKASNYPTIFLLPDGFRLSTFINYYTDTGNDFLKTTKTYLYDLSISQRFFNLVASIILLLFMITSLFLFADKAAVSIIHLPWLCVYSIKHTVLSQNHNATIGGKVLDRETGKAIKNAVVSVINADTNRVIDKCITDVFGNFYSSADHCVNFKFAVQKKGYEVHEFFEYTLEGLQTGKAFLEITAETLPSHRLQLYMKPLTSLLNIGFEFFLIASISMELLFGYVVGWEKACLFLICSLFNAVIWMLYHMRAYTYR